MPGHLKARELIQTLEEIIRGRKFKNHLGVVEKECRHFKQERQIVALLYAHALNDKSLSPVLMERHNVDLEISTLKVEAKYHYEFDILDGLAANRDKFSGRTYMAEFERRCGNGGNYGYYPGLGVISDFSQKRGTDTFLWIIACRHYPGMSRKRSKDRKEMIYEYETRKCLNKHLTGRRTQQYIIGQTIKTAKAFLRTECHIKSKITDATVTVMNGEFTTDYLFLLCRTP